MTSNSDNQPNDPSSIKSPQDLGPPGSTDESSQDGKPNQEGKSPYSFILLVLFLITLALFFSSGTGPFGSDPPLITYDTFIKQVKKKNVESVTFERNVIKGMMKESLDPESEDSESTSSRQFSTVFDPQLEDRTLLKQLLEDEGVEIKIKDRDPSFWSQFFVMTLPFLLVLLVIYFFMRRSSESSGMGMFGNFTRSPAKEFHASAQQTTFKNVAGMETAKEELQEIVEFLKSPEKFLKLGAEIPKGVLLVGPPGTGKTLLARATAGEAKVPFYSVNGSEFIQMFVGVGASRVRDLFANAKLTAPCLIFIDEIDAIGRVRGAGYGGGHDEREQTLNQILSEMDGFTQSESVIVLGATNRPDVLDKALTRPGRFDRHIVVDNPSKNGRLEILKLHCEKVPLSEDVQLEEVASNTIGFSGAELKNLVNEAALHASRESKSEVSASDFEAAWDRILLGVKRDSVLKGKEREMTAYHEAGHALIAWILPELDPVHKVTIVPRGRSLGVTQLRPVEEKHSYGEKQLNSQLAMMLGGRSAEKLVFGEYTVGAEDDLKRATSLARKMVSFWGMSETIGPVAFRHASEDPFLGKEMHEQREFSDQTAHIIDIEIQKVLESASNRAKRLLEQNRELLVKLSDKLITEEILDQSEIEAIIGSRPPIKND